MKRFYCTTCKRVKRVRTLPQLEATAYYRNDDMEMVVAEHIQLRKGECHFHNRNISGTLPQGTSRTWHQNRLRVTGQRQRKGGVKR